MPPVYSKPQKFFKLPARFRSYHHASWLYHGGKYDISCGGDFPFSFVKRKFTDIALVMQGCGGRGEGANEGFDESENLRVALGRVCKL